MELMKTHSSEGRRAIVALALQLLPTLAAVWFLPWFVTQDGPAHLYNARIMVETLKGDVWIGEHYAVNWIPLPNVMGHYLLMAFASLLAPRAADQLIMSLTIVLLSATVVWLRRQTAGDEGLVWVTPLAALLPLNWLWLYGFYNFMLGASVFALTLGLWWRLRDRASFKSSLIFGASLLIGYLCHLVTFGFTLVCLLVLVLATPGETRLKRALSTFGWLPLLAPLAIYYRSLSHGSGEFSIQFSGLAGRTAADLLRYASAIDIFALTLGKHWDFPFVSSASRWHHLSSPLFLICAGLICWGAATLIASRKKDGASWARPVRRVWLMLVVLLALAWLAGPSGFGMQHGALLRERAMLLTLVLTATLFKFERRAKWVRAGALAFSLALLVQTAFIWEYGLRSNRLVGEFMSASQYLDERSRVLAIVPPHQRFRMNPLEHAPEMLGATGRRIVWNNYEAQPQWYFFPVKFRQLPADCRDENIVPRRWLSYSSEGRYSDFLRGWWECWLVNGNQSIDQTIVWGQDPFIEEINMRWYAPIYSGENVRVFARRTPHKEGKN